MILENVYSRGFGDDDDAEQPGTHATTNSAGRTNELSLKLISVFVYLYV